MPNVVLRFSDGVQHGVEVQPGQALLAAAESEGINLLHQCRSGSCSSCICQVESGDLVHVEGKSTSLLPVELEEGKRLSCLSLVESDSVVSFGYPSSILRRDGPRSFQAKVFGVQRVAEDVVRLVVRAPRRESWEFDAGQFLRFRVPGSDAWRSYSMASSSQAPKEMSFFIRLIPEGLMSRWLTDVAKPGDLVDVEGPFGSFFLRPSSGKHIFIAGGTGLAPVLSMIDELHRAPGPRRAVLVSFGCNATGQLFGMDTLDLYSQWFPEFATRISVLDGCTEKGGSSTHALRQGTSVDAITEEDVKGHDTVAYLCGPPPMIEAGRRHLEKLGLSESQIFNETFVAS